MVRARTALLVVCALCIILCSCRRKEYEYPYDKHLDHVEKVEICRYVHSGKEHLIGPPEFYVLIEMDQNDAVAMLEELAAIPSYRSFGDGTRDYGELVVYITYAGGIGEILGCFNTASVDANGKWWLKGYYFDEETWISVVNKYVDTESLSSPSQMTETT